MRPFCCCQFCCYCVFREKRLSVLPFTTSLLLLRFKQWCLLLKPFCFLQKKKVFSIRIAVVKRLNKKQNKTLAIISRFVSQNISVNNCEWQSNTVEVK